MGATYSTGAIFQGSTLIHGTGPTGPTGPQGSIDENTLRERARKKIDEILCLANVSKLETSQIPIVVDLSLKHLAANNIIDKFEFNVKEFTIEIKFSYLFNRSATAVFDIDMLSTDKLICEEVVES